MFTGEILQGTGHRTIGSVAPAFGYLDAVVERMVRQSPEERLQSIAETRAALNIPAVSENLATDFPSRVAAEPSSVQQRGIDTKGSRDVKPGGLPSREAVEDDVFARLRLHIFLAADARKPEAAHFNEYQLTNDFGLNVAYIQEFLVDLHRERLISIAKWYGNRNRPLEEWPSADEFFAYREDGGHVRTTLLRRGKQQLEQLKKSGGDNQHI